MGLGTYMTEDVLDHPPRQLRKLQGLLRSAEAVFWRKPQQLAEISGGTPQILIQAGRPARRRPLVGSAR